MDTIYLILVSFIGIQKLEGFDDLSRGKTATHSPIYPCYPVTCGPDKAVDGDRKTCMRSDYIGPLYPHKTTWWTVDLGGNHSIYSISIDFKDYKDYEKRQRGRFAGFSLFISNTPYKEDGHLCYKNTLPLPPLEFNTTCIGYGRYVIYYNERLDGVTYPKDYQSLVFTELCEVKIEGCLKSGVYGRNCSLSCPINCQEQRCNIVNGTCLGCVPGYIGQMCETECPFGWYGDLCKRQCTGHCNGNISCNHVTGYCDGGCAAGLMGKQCDQQCNMGTYGSGCLQNCNGHCLNNISCNRETGMCNSGCDEGYTGNFCEKECPPGRFGKDCLQECSGKCWNNSGCNHVDGECKEGCAAGYEGKLCNDVCSNGSFGIHCNKTCSRQCIGVCNHVDGKCDCFPGFQGAPNCTKECFDGFFGINCQHKCSGHCLNGEICRKFDGGCPHGCRDQYRGLLCDYQDETSWKIGCSVSVALNMIFISSIVVYIIIERKTEIFTFKKNIHDSGKNCEEANVGSTNMNTITDKQFYEELNALEKSSEYQELQVESKAAYENLAFENA